MTSLNKGRSPNLDIIRIFAMFCVIGVHFFINTEYLETPINNSAMYILTVMRSFFAICVPLFIILSGYLMKNKTLSTKFYYGIVKTLGIYLIASIACHIFHVAVLGEDISILSLGTGIFDFTAAPYGWYVEMYIGLFVLIPFLNLIYNNLGSKKHKLVLVLTLIALTALPSVVNAWNFADPSSFLRPSENSHYIALIPDWWSELYPVTYYFIGCWLREYGLGISKKKNLMLLILSVIFWGVFNIYRSYPIKLVAGDWIGWKGLPQVINATLVFNLLLNIKETAIPEKLYRPLNIIADLCFGAYLMSWVSDQIVYSALSGLMTNSYHDLMFFPVATVLSFIGSLVLSFIINIVYKLFFKLILTVSAKKS